jgi:aralkylamine N-acetyltransferase
MSFELKFGTMHLNWHEVCSVFERAPLGTRDPEKMRRAAENSYVVCSAFDGNTLIGFGRALSDGEYQSAIYDMVVAPEYQGRGVGKAILTALMDKIACGRTLLYAVPGKEEFYKKMGFARLLTGMGRFVDPDVARQKGYIAD